MQTTPHNPVQVDYSLYYSPTSGGGVACLVMVQDVLLLCLTSMGSLTKRCGKVIGYQEASPDAFANYYVRPNDINGAYVDRASLTHGHNPRHHIWTLTAALDEAGIIRHSICPCTHRGGSPAQLPSFIGSSYFCDTGSRGRYQIGTFYGDDPLWDGARCGGSSTCCSFNNPPWFMKQLSSSTSDDLELRVCRDEPRSNEDVGLKSVELYVQ